MMKIELKEIKVSEVLEGFVDNEEEGVYGYFGRLNIRPKYQREFVYGDKQKAAVIDTIFKRFPLNVMYWVEREDGTYELLDGQQRTLSICSYYNNGFAINLNGRLAGIPNLTKDEQEAFMEYPLQVYICRGGTDTERLEWFDVINTAGEKLTQQELRNAQYPGEWLTSIKRRFSKSKCVAKDLGDKYMTGSPIRQDYLETVLTWLADADGIKDDNAIQDYMRQHQNDTNSDREWQYFQKVIGWVKEVFPAYRKEMKGLPWGLLYNRYHGPFYPASEMEEKVKRLMMDDDVTNKRGVYEYVLSGDERKLNIRAFTENMKREAYERQQGLCPRCGKHFEIDEMEGDHITPWSQGGKTNAENCQMLCRECNRRKSDS